MPLSSKPKLQFPPRAWNQQSNNFFFFTQHYFLVTKKQPRLRIMKAAMGKLPHLIRLESNVNEGESIANKNVNWIGPRFFVFFALVMVVFEFLVRLFLVQTFNLVTQEQGWTLVHVFCGVINFVVMHYISGTPGELQDLGEFATYTWWEQLDDGVQWTLSRKLWMLQEIVFFLVTSYLTEYEPSHLVINMAVLLLVMVPKMPQSHRVRIVSEDEWEEEDDSDYEELDETVESDKNK